MNSQEVISLYEQLAGITGEMVSAARGGDWEQLAALEALCANHVETLKREEPPPLPSGAREQKARIIQKILADDREIRKITVPWMEQLSSLLNSADAERKLSKAYGANQSG